MIGMLSGTCLMAGSGEAIIDVGGVGYLVQCGSRTLANLEVGGSVSLHVETHVREQAITLFGFHSEEERAWFVRLQTVQGLGPKAALAILDILTPGDIFSAANLEDKTAFSRASGVGPKLAGRIVMELSGKAAPSGRGFLPLTKDQGETRSVNAATGEGASDMKLRNDAISALANLGFGQSEALRAVAGAYSSFEAAPSLDVLIRVSLKELNS